MQNFNKKILNSTVVVARQSFQFFKQNTWFLESNRPLPFYKGFCGIRDVTELVLPYDKKISP